MQITVALSCVYYSINPKALQNTGFLIIDIRTIRFLIPYQLYVAKDGNDFGLNSIALRAVELIIALLIIYALAHWLNHLGQSKLGQSEKSQASV